MQPASDFRPTVAIIGGGWAGLACALKLARAGLTPRVFEAAPEPGGRARRAKLGDSYLDNGQHLMLSGCRALTQLLNDIGVTLPCTPFAYTDGQRHLSLSYGDGRLGLLVALYRARGFNWLERFQLIRALVNLQRSNWCVPTGLTVAQWLHAQKQPTSLITYFWAPLALAILNTPINQAAMARLGPVLRDTLSNGGAATAMLQPKADLTASVVSPLINAMTKAGGIVHCGQRVSVLQTTPQGYAVRIQHQAKPQTFGHVVLALPPWALTQLDSPLPTSTLAKRFGAQPIATVYLGFAATVRLPTPLVQLAGPSADDARVWAIDRTHEADTHQETVIAVSLSADGPWTQLDNDTLAKRCLENLRPLIGNAAHCLWHKVVTVHKATPTTTSTATLSEHERQPLPGLWLAGDWTHPYYPATLEAAIASGFTTAEQIIGDQS